jgi:valyl-tRNA synthetase
MESLGGRDDVSLTYDPEARRWLVCALFDLDETTCGPGIEIDQDPDVLDTWFSSALWPHSTLGWPAQTPELNYFYPTSVLVTSRDIITLWVARMVLTGLFNVGDVPFRDVFIHPKILDGYGETMSKSKGNGVDPLDVISMYGADSLRFGLAYMATETQDVRMPVEFVCPHCGKTMEQTQKNRTLAKVPCAHCAQEFSTQWAKLPADTALPRGAVTSERFAVARNFCNKLWNAARFALLNMEGYTPGPIDRGALLLEDRWLLSRLNTVTQQVTAALEDFHFADAARALYDFAWDEFCSFYVEMIKTRLQDPAQRPNTQRLLAHALDVLLRLLHPLVPFVTEEVWTLLNASARKRGLDQPETPGELLLLAAWPVADTAWIDPAIELRFSKFQGVLGAIREIRSRQNIAPRVPLNFYLRCDSEMAALLEPMTPYFAGMAGATALAIGPQIAVPALAANTLLPGLEIIVDLAGHIDVAAELQRTQKELEKLRAGIAAKEAKLGNAGFASRAPAEVVAKEREQLAEMQARAAGLERIERELGGEGK